MPQDSAAILASLDAIQNQLDLIRKALNDRSAPREGLEGILEGITVSDEDIEEAKRSLFKAAYDDDI